MSHSGLLKINCNKQKQQGEKEKKNIHKKQVNLEAFTKEIEDQKR